MSGGNRVDNVPVIAAGNGLNNIITTADSFLRKQYLSELHNASVVPMRAEIAELKPGQNVRLFRLNSLSYSSEDDFSEKISNIYNALSQFNCGQVLIIDSDGYGAELYLGVVSNDIDDLSVQFDTFRGSFLGNFPGGKISILNTSKNTELLNRIFDEPNIKISSVSALTVSDDNEEDCVYGIERLVDGMYGKPFTMVLIANAISRNDTWQMRQGLESLYTQLSPLKNYSISINTNESNTYTESLNLTKSESVTEGTSVTENTTFGRSKNTSTAVQKSDERDDKQAKNQIIGTVASLAAVLTGIAGSGSGVNLLSGLFYGSSISNTIGAAQTLLNGNAPVETETTGEGQSYSLGYSKAETSSIQKGFSSSKGISEGTSSGTGKTIQMNCENKPIADLLNVLDMQIKRLQHIEGRGGFGCAAYFITGDNSTAVTAANMYRSFMGNGNNTVQETVVNVWSDNNKIDGMASYLKRLNHPLFQFEKRVNYPVFNAATIAATNELPMYASLPKKSLRGITSSTHAEFAREVMGGAADEDDCVEIGKIFHMGKTEPAKVHLSKGSLRGHLFVAGSTGSGKSNFSYGLLSGLYKDGIKFMVIEPAKGEYYRVFGGMEDVNVFGTNPMMKMPLLRINPFSFPEGVHVNEHIDRLLEIFNSCWPMYAAMPAVLKEGVETIYKQCGYNMITGLAGKDSRFPTFKDLLDVLPKIMEKSAFSGEVKGNYIGSLVTRVKSLTDGLFTCIFTDDEIENRVLFDENVIVDLSRVGSGETKSLIMGLLVMKLQEYRMSKNTMNESLCHVTLLEEAHHLLRGNAGSSAEGVNLREMSLEMITNAIAEMRTYGEGFIIADQSPALMDPAVIRNTNTKVIFKLQENADRIAVSPSLSLSDEQTAELSRLETGVAAVYQSNWDNAVLSKINYFPDSNYVPYKGDYSIPEINNSMIYSQCLSIMLRGYMKDGETSSVSRERCIDILSNAEFADESAKKYIPMIREFIKDRDFYISTEKIYMYIDRIINSKALMEQCGDTEDIAEWDKRARAYISEIAQINGSEARELIFRCIEIRRRDSTKRYNFFYRYIGFSGQSPKMQT